MSYIGNDPAYWNLNVNKYQYTATAAQTSFFAVYDTVVDVYLNGSKLASTDYTATDGMTVVLSSPATLGDIIDIAGYFNFTNFDVDVYLPSQTNNAGKSLTTDGAGTLNWSGPHAPIASPTFTGATTTANTFTSTVASGNAPFVVTSNTLVTNLNADLLDGQHGSYYTTANNLTGTIPSAVLPNSGVTANTYGSLTTIPVITVNAKGLVTGVSTATVAGAVLQVVNATYSTSTGNNSGSYVNTGLTASITPTSASSKIFVFGVVNGTNSQGSTATGIQMGLYKGTSATIIANLGTYLTYNTSSTNNYAGSVSFGYQDSPNTTSAVTYGVAFLRSIGSGNIYVQLDSSVSSITLMEIAG